MSLLHKKLLSVSMVQPPLRPLEKTQKWVSVDFNPFLGELCKYVAPSSGGSLHPGLEKVTESVMWSASLGRPTVSSWPYRPSKENIFLSPHFLFFLRFMQSLFSYSGLKNKWEPVPLPWFLVICRACPLLAPPNLRDKLSPL